MIEHIIKRFTKIRASRSAFGDALHRAYEVIQGGICIIRSMFRFAYSVISSSRSQMTGFCISHMSVLDYRLMKEVYNDYAPLQGKTTRGSEE